VELRDYVAILRRRLTVILMVPALALLAVAGYTVIKPKQFQATATVAAPALVGGVNANQYSGANGLKAFVANFSAAVTSQPILRQAEADTHVKRARIKGGITASEIGSSSLMEVTYKTSSRKTAEPVAKAVASDTILFLFNTQVQLAQQPVDAARKSVTDTETAIADLTRQTGLVVPDKDYEVKAQAVASLQSAQAQALANGQGSTASHLQSQIDQRQKDLANMAPQVQSYQALVDRKNEAINSLNQAQQALNQARAQFAAADPGRVVTLGNTQKVSVLSDLVQRGMVAIVAGLILSLGIVAVLEILAARVEPVTVPSREHTWPPVPDAGQEPFPSRV
jgi:capsular polysaccharide biosynthesis protein